MNLFLTSLHIHHLDQIWLYVALTLVILTNETTIIWNISDYYGRRKEYDVKSWTISYFITHKMSLMLILYWLKLVAWSHPLIKRIRKYIPTTCPGGEAEYLMSKVLLFLFYSWGNWNHWKVVKLYFEAWFCQVVFWALCSPAVGLPIACCTCVYSSLQILLLGLKGLCKCIGQWTG